MIFYCFNVSISSLEFVLFESSFYIPSAKRSCEWTKTTTNYFGSRGPWQYEQQGIKNQYYHTNISINLLKSSQGNMIGNIIRVWLSPELTGCIKVGFDSQVDKTFKKHLWPCGPYDSRSNTTIKLSSYMRWILLFNSNNREDTCAKRLDVVFAWVILTSKIWIGTCTTVDCFAERVCLAYNKNLGCSLLTP